MPRCSNSLLETSPDRRSVAFTRQQKPLGLGHAVWCAGHLGEKDSFAAWRANSLFFCASFAVVLPDDLLVGKPGALKQMVEAYEKVGGGIIVAAEEKLREETQRYDGIQ